MLVVDSHPDDAGTFGIAMMYSMVTMHFVRLQL